MFAIFTAENFRKATHDPIAAFLYLLWINRSFSQAWEDLILNWLTQKSEGVYIDIWANHPIRGNNTYLFYKKWWRGISVEPHKWLMKVINNKRPEDINLQIGIGKTEWALEFYVFDGHAMSTCDTETVKRYTAAWQHVVDSYTVPIWTLERLCDTYIKDKKIDILSVDVEGWDMNVLESNNWDKYRPIYIILETVEYGRNWRGTWIKQTEAFDIYLGSKGYKMAAETGINTIYKLQD